MISLENEHRINNWRNPAVNGLEHPTVLFFCLRRIYKGDDMALRTQDSIQIEQLKRNKDTQELTAMEEVL